MVFNTRPRGTILALVLGVGFILVLAIMSFLVYLQRESRLTSMYSARIAARKLAEMGMNIFKPYIKKAVRSPEFELTAILKKPREDMSEESIPFDLKELFPDIVQNLEELDIKHFRDIHSWEAFITVSPDDFEAFDTPLARYKDPGGTAKSYEKYGQVKMKVRAVVGSGLTGVSAEVHEITEVKVNVSRVPLLADFTLFIHDALATGGGGGGGSGGDSDRFNQTEVDSDGKKCTGPLIVLSNGMGQTWRPGPGMQDWFSKDHLKNQGWVYLGTPGTGGGAGGGNKISLTVAFGNGAYTESGDYTGANEKHDDDFTLYQGEPEPDPETGEMTANPLIKNKEFAAAVENTEGEVYEHIYVHTGVCGHNPTPTYKILGTDYSTPSKPLLLNGKSSCLRLFGIPQYVSPTLVLGNVQRHFLRLCALRINPEIDDALDTWKLRAQELANDPQIGFYTDDWATVMPLYFCNNETEYNVLGTYPPDGSDPTVIALGLNEQPPEHRTRYRFLKEYIPTQIGQYQNYRNWMTHVYKNSINYSLDYIAAVGYTPSPDHVVLDQYYEEGNDALTRYPSQFNPNVEAAVTSLPALLDTMSTHFAKPQRLAWQTSPEDGEGMKLTEFLEEWNYLSPSGDLTLGTVIYANTSTFNSGGGVVVDACNVKRGGVIVCEGSVTVKAPITGDNFNEILTIVSRTGNITLSAGGGSGQKIQAHLVAPNGELRIQGNSGGFVVEGAVAVRTLPQTTLDSITQGTSYIYYVDALKKLPGNFEESIMVDVCPVGDPIPSAPITGGEL